MNDRRFCGIAIVFTLALIHVAEIKGQSPTFLSWMPYQVVWEDDFNIPSIDQSKWCRADWRQNIFGANREDLSAYRTDGVQNIYFATLPAPGNETVLVQQVRQEDHFVPFAFDVVNQVSDTHTYHYSAPNYMASQSKFKYGYFEIRCKLPGLEVNENNLGVGANFFLWIRNQPAGDGAASEIDIYEFIDKPPFGAHTLTCNVHKGYLGGIPPSVHDSPSGDNKFQGPKFYEFHTFGVLWTPTLIQFYRDGSPYYTSVVNAIAQDLLPMRIWIDLNVFTGGEAPDGFTVFPYDYMIDYVRVYQLDATQCAHDYNQCNPVNAQNSVYNKIVIGGGCNYPAPNKTLLSAKESIEILPDFTAGLGSEITMTIAPCFNSKMLNCPTVNCGQCE